MEGEEESGSNAGGWILGLIALAVIGWFVYKAYENYKYGEKKPFWKGTELVQVCKKPYYSSEDCYRLNATLIDDKTVRISFPNGGYKITYDLTCYFAAKSLPEEPKYVFCRSWDSEDQQWDFMPAWAYWPSIEDLNKQLEKYK